MDHTVRRIESPPSKAQEDELRTFSAYDEAANIILLGDPGAGKTYTFRQSSARCGGRYVTARALLVTPAARFDGTPFIDGLDEKRAGRGDRDTVDVLVEKLFAVAPRRIRISCRVADWLSDSDLAALRPYFEQSGDPVVLQKPACRSRAVRGLAGARVERRRGRCVPTRGKRAGLGRLPRKSSRVGSRRGPGFV